MARPRFPGRPGCRYERILVRYIEEESRTQIDPNFGLVLSFCCGLKQFREIVGESDEDEEFEGFTQQEVRASARKYVAMLSSSKNEQDSPESSSSSSSSSLPSVAGHRISGTSQTRRQKVRATMASTPYIKKGLGKKSRSHFYIGRTVQNVYTMPKEVATAKLKNIKIRMEPDGKQAKIVRGRGRPSLYVHSAKKQVSVRSPNSENEKSSHKKVVSFGRGRKRSIVSRSRSKRLGTEFAKHLLLRARKGHDSISSSKDCLLDSDSTPGYQRKHFIMPTKSSRSSRVIKPNKRFLEDSGYHIMFSKSQTTDPVSVDKGANEGVTDGVVNPQLELDKEFSKIKKQQPTKVLQPLSPLPLPPKIKRGRGRPRLYKPPLSTLDSTLEESVKLNKKNMQTKSQDLGLGSEEILESGHKSLPVSDQAESRIQRRIGLPVEPSSQSCSRTVTSETFCLRKTSKRGRKSSLSLKSHCVGTSRSLLQSDRETLRKTRQRGYSVRSKLSSSKLEESLSFQSAKIPEAMTLKSGSICATDNMPANSEANLESKLSNPACPPAASSVRTPVSGRHIIVTDESSKTGLFDQPLVVEGKRQRKPSFRMRLKQSEEILNYKELKRLEVHRLIEDETEANEDMIDVNKDALEKDKTDFSKNLKIEVEEKPCLPSIDQSLPTLPTSPFRPKLELFSPCGSGGSFISPTEKQKLEELDREMADATRRSGNNILRKAKFQLNRAALNRSKAALARSLKAKMRHEAKLEKKRQREVEKQKQTATSRSPLALSSLSVVAKGLTDVHGSLKRSLIKTEGGVTSPAVSPGSTVVTPVATTVTPGSTLTLGQSRQNDGDSSLQPTAKIPLKRSRKMCAVCGNKIGVVSFYGVPCCIGCRKFYMLNRKRKKIPYHCKKAGCCTITRLTKSQCNACRLRRCQELFSSDSNLSAASSVSKLSSRSAYKLSLNTTTKNLTRANKKAETETQRVPATASMETASVAATDTELTSPNGKTPGSNRKGRRSRDTSDEDPSKEESFRVGGCGSVTSSSSVMTSVGRKMSNAATTTSRSLPRQTTSIMKHRRRRKVRCKQCEGCLADDCGVCVYCLDKPKFGGKNVIKQACINRRCHFPSYTNCATNSFILPKKSGDPDEEDADSYPNTPNSHRDRRRRACVEQLGGRPSPGHQPKLGKPNVKLKRPHLFQQFKKRNKEKAVTLCGKSTDSVNMFVQAPTSYWGTAEGCIRSKSSGPLAVRKWTNQDYLYSPAAHRIKVDYKEDCDLCRVWEQGLAILVSAPLCMRTMCYLCGSTGQHDFVYCYMCCEPFHLFCLDEDTRPTEKNQESWCCLRCQYCQVCGKQDNLLQCNKCQDTYHPECLGPNYPTKPSKKKKIWVCTKCVRCKSCGATTPGISGNATWMHDFSLCYECGKLMDRGNFCPICRKCYTDDDWDSKMVQCSTCESWVHATCGGLTDELYQMFSHLPEDVPYICLVCSEESPASWECVIKSTRQHGFTCVMKALQNSKCAQHLMGQHFLKCLAEKKKNRIKSCKPALLTSIDCYDSSPDGSQEVTSGISTTASGTVSPSTRTSPASICHNNNPLAFNRSLKDSSPDTGLIIPQSSVATVITVSTSCTTSCTTSATCFKTLNFRTSDCDKSTACGRMTTSCAKMKPRTYSRVPHICDSSRSQYNETLQNSVRSYSNPKKCLHDHTKRTGRSVPTLPSTQLSSSSSVCTPITIPSNTSPHMSISTTTASLPSTVSQTHSTPAYSYSSSPTCKSVTSSSSLTSPSPLTNTSVPSCSTSSTSSSLSATSSQSVSLHSPISNSVSLSPVVPKPTPFIIPSFTKSVGSTAVARLSTSSTKCVGDSLSSKTTAASPNKGGGACRFVMGPMPHFGFFRRNTSSRSLGISIVSSTASNSISKVAAIAAATSNTINNNQTITTSTITSTSSGSLTNTSSQTSYSPTSLTTSTSIAIPPRSAVNFCASVSSSQTIGNLSIPATIPTLCVKPTTTFDSSKKLTKSSSYAKDGSTIITVTPVGHVSSNLPVRSSATIANKEAFPGRDEVCNQFRDSVSSPTLKTAPFTTPPPLPLLATSSASSPVACNTNLAKKPSDLKTNLLVNCSVNRTFKNEQTKGNPLKGPYKVSKLNTIKEEVEEKEVSIGTSGRVNCENSLGKSTSSEINNSVALITCKSEPLDTFETCVTASAYNQATKRRCKKPSLSPNVTTDDDNYEELGDDDDDDDDPSATDTASEDLTESEKPKYSEVRACLRKERLRIFARARKNGTLIDLGNGNISRPEKKKKLFRKKHIKHPKYFETVIYKVNNSLYNSVQQFTEDIVRIIQSAVNNPKGQTVSRKRANHSVRSIFIKQMEKYFPWFNVKTCVLWDHHRNLPAGMLPNGVIPPFSDHNYAQWMKDVSEPLSSTAAPLWKLSTHVKSDSKAGISSKSEIVEANNKNHRTELAQFYEDTRTCVLCWKASDLQPEEEGRLIYVGQDDWVHVNCALWSAEAFEDEMDGTLQNVQTAINRGKMMRCDKCSRSGATVGCCHRGCPANFHFLCAKQESCVFQEDKKVYCYNHRHKVDGNLVEDNDFDVIRRVCIYMDPQKYPKKSWVKGLLAPSINIVIGSCTIENLGSLTALSDTWDMLLPIGFRSSRVYWSTKHVNSRCVYTCRIIAVKPQCQKVSSDLTSDQQVTIEHNTTKIEDPVLANASMATFISTTENTATENVSKNALSAFDTGKLDSMKATLVEAKPEERCSITDVGDNSSTYNIVEQQPASEMADKCQQPSLPEESECLVGSKEPSASDSLEKSNESSTKEIDGAILDVINTLSPSTQAALETLQDTSNRVFAGDAEKKWLESLPENMEAIVVVTEGEELTDEEAVQLATEALQAAEKNVELGELDSSEKSVEDVPILESTLTPDVEEVMSVEECATVIDTNCNSMTLGKKTLPDNFHETSLYDVTEAQVLTEGNKEVMYLGVENKPVEVISLNRRSISMNFRNKNKCSRLPTRLRDTKSSSTFSPIYGSDGQIIGHKLSITDALSLKTSPQKMKRNDYHEHTENQRARRINSKNSPMRYQTSRKPNSSPVKSTGINRMTPNIEDKIRTSANVADRFAEVKCKVTNGEKWENMVDSPHLDSCRETTEEGKRMEIKEEVDTLSALLTDDKTWSDSSLELVKNQERNKNSPPVKVYPLRQTVSRMCEQALAKRPLEAISRSCRDDRTKSMLVSQSSTEPQTMTTMCDDSVSIKKIVEDTIPLHDQIALKIKAESLAKSSPGERGPFKCPTCKRLYRTKESFETHVEQCDFELSTSEEDDDEQDSLRSPRRYLGNPRYPMRSTTLIQRVAAEVEAEMNLIKKFCPRKRSHDSASSTDTGVIDPFSSRGKQVRQDRPISTTTVDNLAIDCNLQNHPLESKSTLGCDDNACNTNYVAAKSMLTSNTEENKTKNCRIKERQQQDKKQLNSNENDFDSDATLSPAPYDNFLEKNHQSDEESNNSMLCPRTGFTISAGTNRNNLDLLSELATKLSKPEPSNSEKVGHLIGLKSTEPKLPSDIALAKKMSVVEVPGGLYKQKFEVINGKFGKVCSSKESAIVSDFSIVPNHSEKSTMSSAKHHNYLAKTSTSFSKGSIYSSTLSEGASTCGPSENQNKSGHQGLFERIFHSIDVTNTSNSLPNVLENPLSTTSHMSSYNIDSESNVKMNAVTKDGQISVGCGISRNSNVNNCLITKSVSKAAKNTYLPAIHTSSVSQSLTSTTTSSLAINSDHACEANSNQAVPVKCVEAKPSQQPLFVGPSTMTSQVLTTPMVTMGLCNTVCSLPSQTCIVAPSQQLSVPMQSASSHVLGLATTNEPLFQSQVLSSPALPQLATSTAFATGAVTPVTLTQPSKCQPSQPQPTLNINYVGSFVLPTPADQLVTISQSIASIPLSSIATSVPHLQVANSLASVVTSAKLQSPSIAIPHQQNSVMLPDGSIQTLHKTSMSTMQTPNSIVKILVDNSSTQFVTSANIDTSPQPQGSIYNYGKLLQEIFKANQTPPALTNPTDLITSPVNSNQLANERKPSNPVNSITTTTTITTTTLMTTKSSNPGGYTVVSKNVPMRRLISHTSHSKSDFQPPGFLRHQNDTDQLKDSCDPSEILSGVQEGSKFIKNVVDSSSKQDLQIPNPKSYMPPVKKSRLNLCKQPSDVQPTKQIISYLSNKNGLTTSEFPRNLSSSDVCRPKLVKKLLEVNQNTSNPAVLKNTTNQLSGTSPEHQERQQTPDGKIIYKSTTPRSRRKPKPLGRRSRLDMKGICPESYIKNGCSSRQMLQNEGNVQEEEQMPFMSLQSQASVPPNKTVKPDPTKPHIMFEISSEDGFYCRAYSMEDAWQQVFDAVQELRAVAKIKQLPYANVNGTLMFGVSHHSVVYLLEQLHGARNCNNYKFNYHSHQRERDYDDQELAVNPSGCIRTEPFSTRKPYDMFSFLMSRYRKRPQSNTATGDEEMALKSSRRPTSMDLPMAMRFRHLEAHAREAVGVYRSLIHGRGLFCKRNIDAGEMVIEYAGEVIRAELTDKREKFYESKGIGCYMFRIDDIEVVDATMHGNAARFINHSCDPNCYSKVIQVDGKKHIVIFAMRPIKRGEELTYDYKFPIEEIKIPCTCGSRRCRKYLN